MKYVFAGDRDIAVNVLKFMIAEGFAPQALFVSDEGEASHANQLIELSGLSNELIFRGKEFASEKTLELLNTIQPDYIVGIHFPYIIPVQVLNIPLIGFLNLHPAYLPYNRGWHTPSWAILDNTPAGATLHFMAEQLDAGDIIYQEQLNPSPADTANTLYQKLKDLELEVFRKAWPELVSLKPGRSPQNLNEGTAYKRKDLLQPEVQELKLDENYKLRDLLKRVRGLTTSNIKEAAYFMQDGKKYRIQVSITEEE